MVFNPPALVEIYSLGDGHVILVSVINIFLTSSKMSANKAKVGVLQFEADGNTTLVSGHPGEASLDRSSEN